MDCKTSAAPHHPWLQVKHWASKKRRVRSTYKIVGLGKLDDYRAYNVSVTAMERAFKERMYFYKTDAGDWADVPRPIPGLVKEESKEFVGLFKKLAKYSNPIKMSDFPSHFDGAKRVRYQKVVDELSKSAIRDYKRMMKIRHFPKFETYNLALKPDPKPRGINPPGDEALVLLGMRIKPLEKKIYKILELIFGYKIIFKGMNQEQRANQFKKYFDIFDDPVSIEEDASAFEASVNSDWLLFTNTIYMLFSKGDKEFATLLKLTLLNTGSAYCHDGKIKFKFEGRGSGFPDTSLGNCLISAFQFWLFMKKCKVVKHRCGIDGDDKTPIMERADAVRAGLKIKEFYLDLGFRITCGKLEGDFEKLVFCGSSPVKVDGGYVMVREPRKCIAKDSVSRKPLDGEKNFRRWIKSVGECGMAQNGGIPILQEFYACLERNAGDAVAFEKDSFMNEAYTHKVKGMNRKYKSISESTRASFYFAFGISPDEQCSIEAHYKSVVLDYSINQRNVSELVMPW